MYNFESGFQHGIWDLCRESQGKYLLNTNSYRGINLLEHVFKLCEVLDGRLREVVDIDKLQYGFMLGRRTVNAVFVLRSLSEKFKAKDKKLFFIFADLEKAFDLLPREIICFV